MSPINQTLVYLPSLCLITSTPPTRMSPKGFIEPHPSHLPRRARASPKPDRVQAVSDTNKLSVATKMSTKGFVQPHRSHLPRRANTSPNHTRSKRAPPPPALPLESPLSPTQPEFPSEPIVPVPALPPSPPDIPPLPAPTTSPPPPPPFSAAAAALISIAQNKMTMPHPKHDDESLSPVLPHPAMGLTMGLMEAAREAAEGASFAYGGTPTQTPQKTPVPTTLNPSPALGVFGSPTPSQTPVPVSSVGLLGNNLPRRHKRGRETNLRKASLRRGLVEAEESEEKGNLLRLVAVRRRDDEEDDHDGISSLLAPSHLESHSQRACSAPARASSSRTRSKPPSERRCMQVLGRSRVEVGFFLDDLKDYVLLKAVDSLSPDSDSDNDDDSCLKLPLLEDKAAHKDGIPTLTNAQIRDGCEFMKRWIGNSSLLLPTVETDSGDTRLTIRVLTPRSRPEEAMGLALCYLAWAEMDGHEWEMDHPRVVPFGVNDLDLFSGSDFAPSPDTHYAYSSIHHLSMRLLDDDLGEWMGRRAMDEEKEGRLAAVGLGLGILGSRAIAEDSDSHTAGSSRHRHNNNEETRGRTLVRYPPRSENDNGKEKGLHVREAAFGARGGSLSISETCEGSEGASPVGDNNKNNREEAGRAPRKVWMGMRDEWRGVLSFDGLESLIGIWPLNHLSG